MMTTPGITELDKYVDSRYTLVSMVAKRARMIGTERRVLDENGNPVSTDQNLEKPVTQAVEEISEGVVGYIRSEAIKRANEYEQHKIDAISQLENEQTVVSEDAE